MKDFKCLEICPAKNIINWREILFLICNANVMQLLGKKDIDFLLDLTDFWQLLSLKRDKKLQSIFRCCCKAGIILRTADSSQGIGGSVWCHTHQNLLQTCSAVSSAGTKIALTLHYCPMSKGSSRNAGTEANTLPLMFSAIIFLLKSKEETET